MSQSEGESFPTVVASSQRPVNTPPSDCVELLAWLFATKRVRTFEYFEAESVQPIQEVVAPSEDRKRLIREALALRQTTGIPFIDAVMLQMLRTGPDESLIAAVGRHYSYLRSHHTLNGPPLDAIRELLTQCRADRMLIIASEVILDDGAVMHIPMLDFRFPPGGQNELLAGAILRALGVLPGYLLASGNSYHFYGCDLLTADEIRKLLSRALIYGPIIDKTWAAHQLLDGYCGLRISPRLGVGLPRVVAFLSR